MTNERKENLKKWALNLGKFTAPILAIFFFQLSQGVDIKSAGLIAVYALYALLADYFKKIK